MTVKISLSNLRPAPGRHRTRTRVGRGGGSGLGEASGKGHKGATARAGGGTNHRNGLDDAIMIKDNHIRLAGGVEAAMKRMKAARDDMAIEIEVQSLEQVDRAIAAKANIIMLDNMSIDEMREAVRRIAGRAKIEISGGVTLDRIPELASTGADYVSVGALTHSAPAADLSFELEPDN